MSDRRGQVVPKFMSEWLVHVASMATALRGHVNNSRRFQNAMRQHADLVFQCSAELQRLGRAIVARTPSTPPEGDEHA